VPITAPGNSAVRFLYMYRKRGSNLWQVEKKRKWGGREEDNETEEEKEENQEKNKEEKENREDKKNQEEEKERYRRVYPKVSGQAAWSENCKWYNSLPLGAIVSLFLWVSLVSFPAITSCIASQRVFIVVCFVIYSVRKLSDTSLYVRWKCYILELASGGRTKSHNF
jgi:Flp pilus assembly protein TadB